MMASASRTVPAGWTLPTHPTPSDDGIEAPEGSTVGTPWSQIPDDWCRPDCGVREKVDFVLGDYKSVG